MQKGKKSDPSIEPKKLFFGTVLEQIQVILSGFDDAKQSIKLVSSKNSQVKQMLDQLEKDLNALRNKSRRHMIQTNMNSFNSQSQADSQHNNFNLQLLNSGPTMA